MSQYVRSFVGSQLGMTVRDSHTWCTLFLVKTPRNTTACAGLVTLSVTTMS